MKQNNQLLLFTITAALGGLLFGYDTGVINGAQFYLSKYFDLDAVAKGWVVGSALLGCMAGAIVAGLMNKFFGRKNTLIISAILFTVSAYGSGLPDFMPQSVSLLVFFRIVGGLGIGIASMTAPMYIAEISPAEQRGKMVTYYQLAIVVGFFVVFLSTYFIGNGNSLEENTNHGWRTMFWSELIPSCLFFLMLFMIPKSPRWLAIKGKIAESKSILGKLYGEKNIESELAAIQNSIEPKEKSKVNIFSKTVLPIIIIGTILSALQQFTGINAVLYYGADIFEKALGMGQDKVLEQQVLLAFVNLVFTFIALFTVDKIGRKPLLFIGGFGMLLGFLILGGTLMTENVGILSLIGVLIFIGSFAMSMGPVVWVILSEIFPNNIRSIAMSIAVAAQWIANYFVAQTFPMVMESSANESATWNGSMPYFIFSGFIIIIILFTWKYIPETKGKSLEELEKTLVKN